MIIPRELRLKNVVSYKEAKIDLAVNGVTTIYGRNQDCGKNAKSNNGAGKSLLMRQVPLLRFRNPVLNTGKRSIKSAYNKESHVEFDFDLTHQESSHRYTYICKGGKEFDILRDGKASKMRTQGYAQDAIQKLIPMSEEEFYSLYYLDARRPSLLQMGKEAARLEFFTQMFRLDDFDDLKRLFSGDLSDLKGEQKSLKEVTDILERMKGRITVNIEELIKEQQISEANYARLEIKLNKKREELDKLRTVSVLLPAIDRLSGYLERKSSVDKWLESIESKISSESKKLRVSIEAKKEWESYTELLEEATGKRGTINKSICSLVQESELDLNTWKAEKESWNTRYAELSVEQIQLDKLKDELTQAGFSKGASFDTTIEQLDAEIEELRSIVVSETAHQKNYNRFLQLSTHVKDSDAECPLCRSEISQQILEELTQDTEDKKERSLNKVRKVNEKMTSLYAIRREIESHEGSLELYTEFKKKKRVVSSLSQDLPSQEQLYAYSRVEKLLIQRKAIRIPEEPETQDVDIGESVLTTQLDTCNSLKHDLQLVKRSSNLLSTCEEFSEESLMTLEKEVTSMSENLNLLHEKMFASRSVISQYKHDQIQIDELEIRSTDITTRLEDLPVYEMLTEAYGNRGLKRIVVQNISKRIEDNMNRFSPLLNRENVEYSFEVNPTTVDIRAKRKTGISDVCELSGAESRIFNFLIPLSIMSMIPEKQRYGLLVADEPITACDDVLKEMFIEEFLPMLNTLFPSIIILEPGTVNYNANRVIDVVRKNGTTTIHER